MQITVYLDVLFLINFIACFVALLLTGIVMKQKLHWIKLILGALCATLTLLLFVFFPSSFQSWKGIGILFIASLGTVAIPYGRNRQFFWRAWFLTTTIMVLIGCIMNYFRYLGMSTDLHIVSWMILFGISAILLFSCMLMIRGKCKRNDNIYIIQLKQRNRIVVEMAYMDTGNLLIDPIFQKPVMILSESVVYKCVELEEQKIIKRYLKEGKLDYQHVLSEQIQMHVCFHEIFYKSVGESSGKLLCILLDEIKILGDETILRKQPVAIVPDEVFHGNIYKGLLYRGCI